MACREKEQHSLVNNRNKNGEAFRDPETANSHSRISGTGKTYSGFNLIMSREKDGRAERDILRVEVASPVCQTEVLFT